MAFWLLVSQKFAYRRKRLISSHAIYGVVRRFRRISHDLITFQAILATAYSLLVKNALFSIEPINLAIVMYFVTAFLMSCYALHRRTREKTPLLELKSSRIVISAIFGALGTFLIYSALKNSLASKVYPLMGLQAVFVFFIAFLSLKERFAWHRLLGTLLVFGGIWLVSM